MQSQKIKNKENKEDKRNNRRVYLYYYYSERFTRIHRGPLYRQPPKANTYGPKQCINEYNIFYLNGE